MISRHVEVLYCDDIRYEVNGKVSYIGVYSRDLFVPSFPAILPRLCVDIKTVTGGNAPFNTLTIKILKDSEELKEFIVNESDFSAANERVSDLSTKDLKEKVQVAQVRVVFSPMKFDGACKLKVVLQTENGELQGLPLRISQKINPEENLKGEC